MSTYVQYVFTNMRFYVRTYVRTDSTIETYRAVFSKISEIYYRKVQDYLRTRMYVCTDSTTNDMHTNILIRDCFFTVRYDISGGRCKNSISSPLFIAIVLILKPFPFARTTHTYTYLPQHAHVIEQPKGMRLLVPQR